MASLLLSAEKLYLEQRLDDAAALVQRGLRSCGTSPSDLARLRLLEGTLKFEEFSEGEAREAFAKARALDGALSAPDYMPPRARQMFEAAKPGPAVDRAPSQPRNQAKILEVAYGRAVLAAGTEEGFRPGLRVRVIVPQQAPGRAAAVLRVVQAQMHTAVAELGRGDQVQPGDLVEATEEPLSEQLLLPRRAAFTSRLGLHARPFLWNDLGTIAEGYYAWHSASVPIAVAVRLGRGLSTRQAYGTIGVTGAFATDFFEMGLGIGAAAGNTSMSSSSTLTFDQVLRVGSLDGLNFGWGSSFFPTGVSCEGELNVPLLSRLSLFAAGGFGAMPGSGFGFGELGMRTYWGGTGARGTLIFSASGGFAGLTSYGSTSYGPSVGLGLEWRL